MHGLLAGGIPTARMRVLSTRPDSEACKALTAQGLNVVGGSLDDEASLAQVRMSRYTHPPVVGFQPRGPSMFADSNLYSWSSQKLQRFPEMNPGVSVRVAALSALAMKHIECLEHLPQALAGVRQVYCHALSKDAAKADPLEVTRAETLAKAAKTAEVQLIVYNR